MKVAIVASHGVWVDHLESFLPEQITAILAGGGAEMDACVQRYARREGLAFAACFPDYWRDGTNALRVRNQQLAARSDMLLAFWDGCSRNTRYTIEDYLCMGHAVCIYLMQGNTLLGQWKTSDYGTK